MSDESHMVWPARDRKQFHAGLFRRPITFLIVALHTCADEVLPRFLPAASPWYNVVHGKRQVAASTILTFVAVTPQNVLP